MTLSAFCIREIIPIFGAGRQVPPLSNIGVMIKRISYILVAAALCAAVAVSCRSGKKNEVKPTKNLIVMITDGTSGGLLSLTRWYKQYLDPQDDLSSLAIDPYICGLLRTFCSDSPIAESSGSMSQYMTGVLQQGRNISVYPMAHPEQDLVPIDPSRQWQPQATLLEAGKILQHKSVGVVATCYMHHATPAATSSHSVERSAAYDITRQMASQGLDVCFAGGTRYVDSDVQKILADNGIAYYNHDINAFRAHKEGKVWAIFNPSHMMYEIDRTDDEPSLTEMTTKAIELLSKNKNGFFLMVEGSKVDMAAHAKDPIGTVTEFIEFNNAVQAAIDFAKKDGNTTVVVVPDHGTSGIQMGDANYRDYTKKGLDSMFINFKNYRASGVKLDSMIRRRDMEQVAPLFKEWTGIELSDRELDAIRAHKNKTASNYMNVSLEPSLSAQINKILTDHTHIGFVSGNHTGEDVFYAIYNPNGQHPTALIKNIDLNRYMRDVMGLPEPLEQLSDELFVKHTDLFAEGTFRTAEGEDGPELQVTVGTKSLRIPSNRSFVYVDGNRKELASVVPYIRETGTFYCPKDILKLVQ